MASPPPLPLPIPDTIFRSARFLGILTHNFSRLCRKAGTRPGTASFLRTVRRAGDLAGVLVNATLRTEGQIYLLQVLGGSWVARGPGTWYGVFFLETCARYGVFHS